MKKNLLTLLFILGFLPALASGLPYHCDEDAAKAQNIIEALREKNISRGDMLVYAAEQLIGLPEDTYYSTDSVADLRINVDSFSPLMFINTVIALTRTAESPGFTDMNLLYKNLENISCRRGENKGFPSIMYHTSDWIGDNVSRGNIAELTENFPGAVARTKSLDEMTRFRNNFAALSDSAVFETVRMTEMGFRTHRIPSLKKETIKKKDLIEDLKNGDIIILVPNRDGIDCYDIGFIKFEDGLPYLIHLSPQSRTIVKEKEDLARYMALMTKHFQGYRILRLRE